MGQTLSGPKNAADCFSTSNKQRRRVSCQLTVASTHLQVQKFFRGLPLDVRHRQQLAGRLPKVRDLVLGRLSLARIRDVVDVNRALIRHVEEHVVGSNALLAPLLVPVSWVCSR